MLRSEVAQVLTLIGSFDRHFQPTESDVVLWSDMIADYTLYDALQAVKDYHRQARPSMRVGDLIAALDEMTRERDRQAERTQATEYGLTTKQRNCNRPDCLCTHTPPCYKGRLENLITVTEPDGYQHKVAPDCPTCAAAKPNKDDDDWSPSDALTRRTRR